VARKAKAFTREQVQSRKDKAVQFTWDVLGDAARAQEIEAESIDDYATRRHMQLSNPNERRRNMARKTVEDYKAEIDDLKSEIQELEEENEDLQERLDRVADIIGEDEEGDDDDDEEEDADDGDDSQA
jgi:predicted RNase H-like nuclease (RuvC/YqgF family)